MVFFILVKTYHVFFNCSIWCNNKKSTTTKSRGTQWTVNPVNPVNSLRSNLVIEYGRQEMPQRKLRPKNRREVDDCIFRLPKQEIRKPFFPRGSDHQVNRRGGRGVEHCLQALHGDLQSFRWSENQCVLQTCCPRACVFASGKYYCHILAQPNWLFKNSVSAHLRFLQLACLYSSCQVSSCPCHLFSDIKHKVKWTHMRCVWMSEKNSYSR